MKSFRFGVPMIWREPKNHFDNCYFCKIDLKGFNRHKKKSWKYPNLVSAWRPIPHCETVPVSQSSHLPDMTTNWNDVHESLESSCDSGSSVYDGSSTIPEQISQEELSNLIRDLNLSQNGSEILASSLKDKNSLSAGTTVTFYRTKEKKLLPYFCLEDGLVYCKDVEGLLLNMGVPEYRYQDWRLFVDSFKRSLNCIFLHKGNQYASVPIDYSTKLKEECNNIKRVLEKLKYHEHQWLVCIDLKMINFLLGQQSG